MKHIHLNLAMGATKGMLMAALLELHHDPSGFMLRLNSCGVPGVTVRHDPCARNGITGTAITADRLTDAHGHGHTPRQISRLIESLRLSPRAKRDAQAVYALLARAECKVHGVRMDELHFHEVGSPQSVATIAGVCMLVDELAPASVTSTPINVGGGQVNCAHGLLPVPTPVTAELLKGIPIYDDGVQAELCTPSGAALLKYYVRSFGAMPPMTVAATGYGMGWLGDCEQLHAVRALLGEAYGTRRAVSSIDKNRARGILAARRGATGVISKHR